MKETVVWSVLLFCGASILGFFAGRITSPYLPGNLVEATEGLDQDAFRLSPNGTGSGSGFNHSLFNSRSGSSPGGFKVSADDPPMTASDWAILRRQALSTSLGQIESTLGELFKLQPSGRRDALIRELLGQWATIDPQAALIYVEDFGAGEFREESREEILAVWAGDAPAEAMSWFEANLESFSEREKGEIYADIIRGLADNSVESAIDHLVGFADNLNGREVSRAIDRIIDSMLEQGRAEDAVALLSTFPPGELRNDAARKTVGELAEIDVEAALELLDAFSGSDSYASLQRELVREWAGEDPAAAAAYLSQIPPSGNEFSDMAHQVLRRWDDLAAASVWLAQYEPSPELDRPTMVLVYKSSQADPEGAISWARSLTSEGMKTRALQVVASNWKNADPAAFDQYLNSPTGLTEEQIELMRSAPARSFGGRLQ